MARPPPRAMGVAGAAPRLCTAGRPPLWRRCLPWLAAVAAAALGPLVTVAAAGASSSACMMRVSLLKTATAALVHQHAALSVLAAPPLFWACPLLAVYLLPEAAAGAALPGAPHAPLAAAAAVAALPSSTAPPFASRGPLPWAARTALRQMLALHTTPLFQRARRCVRQPAAWAWVAAQTPPRPGAAPTGARGRGAMATQC